MSKDDKDKNKDFTVSEHLSNDKLKMIQDTYDIYSDEAIEVKRKAAETKPVTDNLKTPEPSPPRKEGKKSKFAYEPIAETKKAGSNKIITDIESIENLNPDLQKNIKRLVNSVTKQEVNKLIDEIEKEKDKFLTKNNSILGKMSNTEKMALERKMAETEVSKEVTEVNLTAILSGLNNLNID